MNTGEAVVRSYFEKHRLHYMQLDLLYKSKKNLWTSAEIKYTEIFTPGNNFPYYAQGLPPWQVKSRLELYEEKAIPPMLFIVEKSNIDFIANIFKKDSEDPLKKHLVWYQNLIILDQLPSKLKYTTPPGPNCRVLYPVEEFKKMYMERLDIE